MGQINSVEKDKDNRVAGVTSSTSSAYVPPLQRTKGQPAPIAANGGLSYMSFDRNGDAGTAAATAAALQLLAEGKGGSLLKGSTRLLPVRSRPSGASDFGATRSAWNIFERRTSKPLKAA